MLVCLRVKIMTNRRRSFRPSSVEELFAVRDKNKNQAKNTDQIKASTPGKKDSLSKTKKRTGKNPITGVPNTRRPGKQETSRMALGLEPTEDQSQMQVIDFCKLVKWKGKYLSDYIHHSPNGGKRSISEAARFRAMGTKAGFPDLFLPIAVEPFHGLFIEMKTSKGVISASQEAYHPSLIQEGYRVESCYSANGAITLIKNYLGL
jgi:hypothetical protein